MGSHVRRSLSAVTVLVLVAVFSAVPTQAKGISAPVRGLSTTSWSDASIASERRLPRGARSGNSMPAAGQSAPSAPCTGPGIWLGVNNPNGSWNNELGGIAAVNATDLWAVGSSQASAPTTFGPAHQNMTEHWDGKFWSIVATLQPGADDNFLNDVAAVSTNDVWAVGESNTTGGHAGTTLHWNGASWTQFSLPSTPLNGQTTLNDVTQFGTGDVWAVGAQQAYNSTSTYVFHPLVIHWTGAAWQYVAVPTTGEGDSVLFGVGGSSSSDLYAVGYSRATTTSIRSELILHWNGTTWTATALPTGSASRTLYSVAALSTTDAMAVGHIAGASSATLAERSINGGASWTSVGTVRTDQYNVLGDVAAASPSTYYAVGYSRSTWTSSTSYSVAAPLFGTWSGSAWAFSPGQGRPSDAAFFAMVNPMAGDIWAVGDWVLPNGLDQTLIETYNAVAAPNNVAALAGDQSATVSWTAPMCDGGSAITQYVVFAYDGCTAQSWMLTALTSVSFTGLTNGTAYTFRVAPVNGFGMGQLSMPSNAVTPTGATTPSWVTACSRQQYQLAGNNGGTWQDIDPANLGVTFTPAADSYAILSGNADLWTDTAGYNQDLGIAVTGAGFPTTAGQPEGWKESGGFAGTYSPNAAFVQTVISVKASTSYTARLQWKANKSDPGTIWAGAGPLLVSPGDCFCPPSPQTAGYSPTRLSVQLVPAANVFKKSSSAQYNLTGNDGATWMDMDATNLTLSFTAPSTGTWIAYVSGNSDLWTSSAGYNQDIGVTLSGPGFPTTAGQPEAWKESGGFAGTFSPNAAFVQSALPVIMNTTYTAKLQWKANKPDPGTIWAGAGPIGSKYSPTALTVILVPVANGSAVSSTAQYPQTNSDGTYWQPIDSALKFTLAPGTATSYQLSANADLWTANAGYNQDVGIMVSGGGFGAGTLVAWKESGGFAGTYSPNAAFVTAMVHLQPGSTYTVWAVWKANRIATASNQIFIGAGPIGTKYSPTWLTAMQLSSP